AVARLSANLHIGSAFKKNPQSFAYDLTVVGDEHAVRHGSLHYKSSPSFRNTATYVGARTCEILSLPKVVKKRPVEACSCGISRPFSKGRVSAFKPRG